MSVKLRTCTGEAAALLRECKHGPLWTGPISDCLRGTARKRLSDDVLKRAIKSIFIRYVEQRPQELSILCWHRRCCVLTYALVKKWVAIPDPGQACQPLGIVLGQIWNSGPRALPIMDQIICAVKKVKARDQSSLLHTILYTHGRSNKDSKFFDYLHQRAHLFQVADDEQINELFNMCQVFELQPDGDTVDYWLLDGLDRLSNIVFSSEVLKKAMILIIEIYNNNSAQSFPNPHVNRYCLDISQALAESFVCVEEESVDKVSMLLDIVRSVLKLNALLIGDQLLNTIDGDLLDDMRTKYRDDNPFNDDDLFDQEFRRYLFSWAIKKAEPSPPTAVAEPNWRRRFPERAINQINQILQQSNK